MTKYDVAIIGGGPGGYVAAIKASQLKMSVCLIEKEHLGGVCLNWGCIPTKALLKSAEVFRQIKNSTKYGIITENARPDIVKIVERSRGIASQLNRGIKALMKKNKITVIDGHAKIIDTQTLQVNSKEIFAKNILLLLVQDRGF